MTMIPYRINLAAALVLLATSMFLPATGQAHCDTLEGPVVRTARTALEQGDPAPLFKWVRAADETEIRQAFQKTMVVRAKGAEAKELADSYFFETLVRIHRAGEGMPFTGLKSGASVDPAVALVDQGLASGSVDQLLEELTQALANGIRQRFAHARDTRRHAEESVTAGREFVEAYVAFTHYVEGLHGLITGTSGHHGATAGAPKADAHGHE